MTNIPLPIIGGDRFKALQQAVRIALGRLEDRIVIEAQVATIAKRLVLSEEGRLASLPQARDHHNREVGERITHQFRQLSRTVS